MLRRVARRLSVADDTMRHVLSRLDSFEKEVLELRNFRAAVEQTSPEVAVVAARLAEERAMQARTAHLSSCDDNATVDITNPLTPAEFDQLHFFHALQPDIGVVLANLLHINSPEHLYRHARVVHREYLTRISKRARSLNHAPLGLAQMPAIQELRHWYEWSFHDVSSVAPPVDRESGLRFDHLIRRVFLRHYNTSDLLSRGLFELAQRELWTRERLCDPALAKPFAALQEFFAEFCETRVALRFLVGNYMYLSHALLRPPNADTSHRTDPQFFGHDPSTFVGQICKATSLPGVAQYAIASARAAAGVDEDQLPEVRLSVAGDPAATLLSVPMVIHDVLTAIIGESIRSNVVRCEHVGVPCTPVDVLVAQRVGCDDFVVRVSDTAGGMLLRDVPNSLTYLSSVSELLSSNGATKSRERHSHGGDGGWSSSPVRVPYAAVAARVFGGAVNVASVEGYGTDRFVHFLAQDFEKVVL